MNNSRRRNTVHQYFLLLLTAVLLTSCGKYDEIEITNVSDVNIKGFDNNALLVNLKLEVNNPSCHRIKITDFDTRLFLGDSYIGKLTTDNQVVLKPKSKEIHELKLRIRVANFLGTAMSLMSLKPGQEIKVKLEGTVTARTLYMKKLISINETRKIVI